MHNSTERKPLTTARMIVSTPAQQDQPIYDLVEHVMVKCEDCGGTGIDCGSLHQAEPCQSCAGYGDVLAPAEVARIARKTVERSKTVESDTNLWSFEERKWRVGE